MKKKTLLALFLIAGLNSEQRGRLWKEFDALGKLQDKVVKREKIEEDEVSVGHSGRKKMENPAPSPTRAPAPWPSHPYIKR